MSEGEGGGEGGGRGGYFSLSRGVGEKVDGGLFVSKSRGWEKKGAHYSTDSVSLDLVKK